jgi:glycosyltransferase involved in cell wall biosynthesis
MLPTPLTIVHVVYSSRIAGGEQHCIDLAHAQQALGHRVHVVGPARSAVEGALNPGVSYHGMALPLMRGLRLRRIVRKLQAQVCHAHLGPACKAAAKTEGCARVGTLHVGYKSHQHEQLDGLICVNQTQPQQLSDYAGDFRIIHNWAPERRMGSASAGLRGELGLNPSQLLVGSVGRLHSSKGMDVLVSAFKAYAPQDAVLAILGEGRDRAQLERLADGDSRIHLLGFRREVDAAMQAMDLFVSPSREEAFPLAILEAMRAGLPIISTTTQGPREMLAEQPATLVPIADVPAMGRALQRALSTLRGSVHGQRPRPHYELGAYDRGRAVGQVLSFYDDLLTQTRRPRGMRAPDPRSAVLHA